MNTPRSKLFSAAGYLQLIFFGVAILYFGKVLFIPLFFGLLVAIVMFPACKWLELRGWPRLAATSVCLLIVSLLAAALVGLFIWQLCILRHDLPQITGRVIKLFHDMQEWINERQDILGPADWLRNVTLNAGSMAGDLLKGIFLVTVDILFMFFMIPVFAALFLYHRQVFVRYLQIVVGTQYRMRLDSILREVINTYSRYIGGMVMVYVIVGTLNSAGLLLLGIRHAILFGMLAAFMTIIPYVGIIVSALLPISVAWTTKGSLWYSLGL